MRISETSSAQSASDTVSKNTSDSGATSLSGTRSWISAKVIVVAIKLHVRIMNAAQENQSILIFISFHTPEQSDTVQTDDTAMTWVHDSAEIQTKHLIFIKPLTVFTFRHYHTVGTTNMTSNIYIYNKTQWCICVMFIPHQLCKRMHK